MWLSLEGADPGGCRWCLAWTEIGPFALLPLTFALVAPLKLAGLQGPWPSTSAWGTARPARQPAGCEHPGGRVFMLGLFTGDARRGTPIASFGHRG